MKGFDDFTLHIAEVGISQVELIFNLLMKLFQISVVS